MSSSGLSDNFCQILCRSIGAARVLITLFKTTSDLSFTSVTNDIGRLSGSAGVSTGQRDQDTDTTTFTCF